MLCQCTEIYIQFCRSIQFIESIAYIIKASMNFLSNMDLSGRGLSLCT